MKKSSSEILNLVLKFLECHYNGFYWIMNKGIAKIGDRAGSVEASGYRIIKLDGERYKEHRLIYALFNPDFDIFDYSLQIDHINGIRDDNRIENLRLVTHQENSFNRKKDKGFSWHKGSKKFRARIIISGEEKHLGSFDYATDARLAYVTAKKKYHIIEERA